MLPLSSPRRSRGFSAAASPSPQRQRLFSASAYGTFDGEGDALPRRSGVAAMSARIRGSTTAVSVLQVAGVVAIFLFTAACMVLQLSAQSPQMFGRRAPGLDVSRNRAQQPSLLDATEDAFVQQVNATRLREFLHAYASTPHVAGSAQDYQTVLYTAQQFASFGFKVSIEQYETLLSLPVRQRVAIVSPASAKRELNLTEARVDGDACTSAASALPPFLAYSASGNITGAVIYLNFGRPEDFDWIKAQGISLQGKIALVRYGKNYRGLKVMLAEQHGMAGVLVYSDPLDDGFGQGPTYPQGQWRPEGSFQRGSAHYMSLYTGDPLTPGYAATRDAPRLSVDHATNIPHIPAAVLSYEQASFILEALGGSTAPASWQGSLPLANHYQIGDDDEVQINLDQEIDNHVGPIWNVLGRIDGSIERDQMVLVGNHRDAWVCGAVDPGSGTAALLELARGLGELMKQGWRPRRSIVLASWDGEEYALLGSTEHAEEHTSQLQREAVAYLNIDNVAGPLVGASGTPSIATFLHQTAKDVPADRFYGNETAATLFEQWVTQATEMRTRNPLFEKVTLAPDHLVQLLGSGTDFTPFYQHLGIVSGNLMFHQRDGQFGVYHSSMDSPKYLEEFADPQYATQVAATQWWGLLTMRLASNVLLPLDFTTYALVMSKDLADFEAASQARNLRVDYAALHRAISEFASNAQLFHARIGVSMEAFSRGKESELAISRWNRRLVQIERQFIASEGLPHRPWYRHVVFGPGFYEGYGGTAFPGIADALVFQDEPAMLQAHVERVAQLICDAARFLQEEST